MFVDVVYMFSDRVFDYLRMPSRFQKPKWNSHDQKEKKKKFALKRLKIPEHDQQIFFEKKGEEVKAKKVQKQ